MPIRWRWFVCKDLINMKKTQSSSTDASLLSESSQDSTTEVVVTHPTKYLLLDSFVMKGEKMNDDRTSRFSAMRAFISSISMIVGRMYP